ncbi:MAG: HD domain-containing protein [Nitrospirae bacterium]|nr:HD domain-containing protein [Nitrospirota bacterium]MBF0541215.1 HD domain-containing protein [Nitrospirota bacterium]
MSGIDLKEHISENEISGILDDLIKSSTDSIGVYDSNNNLIKGSESILESYPIIIEGETIGQVRGKGFAKTISIIITNFINKDMAIDSLTEEILDKYTELNFIYDMDETVHSTLNTDEATVHILSEIKNLFNADNVSMFTKSKDGKTLVVTASIGKEYEKGTVVSMSIDNIIGHVYLNGAGQIVNDTASDKRFGKTSSSVKSMMCVPLKSRGNIQGVIYLGSVISVNYTAENLKQLSVIAIHTAYSLESAWTFSKLTEMLYATTNTLTQTLKTKSKTISEHSRRVSQTCHMIAISMGLSLDKVIDLRLAALVHDIGKLGIDEALLNKKETELTAKELELIAAHTYNSSKFMDNMEQFKENIEPGVRWHHERYDGTGYPDKLSGQNIPLIARIIAVANEYDIMVHGLGRHAVSSDTAAEQIKKGAGSSFDPDIVRVFNKLYIENFIK